MKKKTLCKLSKKKNLDENWEEYVKLVKSPRYVCQNCGRAAKRKKYLCDPIRI
ncbi:hypothetical protein ACFLT9_00525 [Acidobacteriota bacterium]